MNIRRFLHYHIDPELIIDRYKTGKNDLLKGIDKGVKISDSQKAEILAFWKPFKSGWKEKISFDLKWFDIYNRTNIFGFDIRKYIPDSYYYCIVDSFFNDYTLCVNIDDKNLYDLFFGDINQPKTICRKEGNLFLDNKYRVISEFEAIKLCQNYEGGIILKSTIDTCAGAGISKWNSKESTIDDLKVKFNASKHLIVQELIKQHDCLSQFNDTCVNTLRIVTLLLNGEVSVVTAVVIMGGKNATTNHLHGGGIVCGIHQDGSLFHTAFDGKLNEYKYHPNGIPFESCKIINYEKCVQLVQYLAPRVSRFSKLVSWDITIDSNGEPMLIEPNLCRGGVVQIAAGPVFGERTEEVLNYVRTNNKWR